MKKTISMAVVILAGCSSSTMPTSFQSNENWTQVNERDEFTSKSSCTVSVKGFYLDNIMTPVSNSVYPYIKKTNDGLFVGIARAGKIKAPVGTVQLKVDDNPPITILTNESTNTDPSGIDTSTMVDTHVEDYAVNAEQAAKLKSIMATAQLNASKAMLPYTNATGDKANMIIV